MMQLGVLFFVIGAVCDSTLYQKVLNTFDPEARCLDGTPGLLYIHQGKQTDKFLVFFEGGAWCGDETLSKTLQSCYKRSKTMLGSSTPWPAEMKGQGYLSTDPANNRFAEWTKIIFGYCDGAGHQGYTKDPIQYKGTSLYFRGAAITRSHFQYLDKKYGLYSSSQVVLTGGSAGGLADFLWNNYLYSKLRDSSILSTIADSGIFPDALNHHERKYSYRLSFQNLFKISNKDELTPNYACNALYRNQQWRCMFFQYSHLTLRGRVMVVNSQYDSWSIPNVLGIHCLQPGKAGMTLDSCSKSQINYIEEKRQQFIVILNNFISQKDKSVWSIACSNHVYACLNAFYNSSTSNVPAASGNTVQKAVQEFVFQGKTINEIDLIPWPNNAPCSR